MTQNIGPNDTTRVESTTGPRAVYVEPTERFDTTTDYRRERAVEHSSVSWRAIFAGSFISLLAYFILASLGLAIAGSTLQNVITGQEGIQGLGIGSAIWLVLSVIISLAVGSYLAGRVAGLISSRIGAVQGLVITALFFGFLFMQVSSGVNRLAGGVGTTIGALGGATGDIASNPQVQQTVERALSGLNLRSPPGEVAQGLAVRLLSGDAEGAKTYLANQARISEARADQIISNLQTEIQNIATNVGSTLAQIAMIAAWTAFIMMTLGSISAVFGGMAGARGQLRRPVGRKDREKIHEEPTRAA